MFGPAGAAAVDATAVESPLLDVCCFGWHAANTITEPIPIPQRMRIWSSIDRRMTAAYSGERYAHNVLIWDRHVRLST
jgi:hypothetical protein